MSWRVFGRFNTREHVTIYILATLSNLLLSLPEYLAVRAAVVSFVPVDSSTASLVSRYGLGVGLTLDLLYTLLVFQAILLILVAALAISPILDRGWRWLYVFSGMILSGFVGYWLGAKFLRSLGWISLLENNGYNSSSVYADLFWFGLAATISYIVMILFLRKSYDKLVMLRNLPRP